MTRDGDDADRDLQVAARYDAWIGPQLKELITDELIAEHERDPLGRHSDALARMLHYFRRRPISDKLAIVCTEPDRSWRICRLADTPGTSPTLVDDEIFDSERKAHHGVFLRRIGTL